MTFYLYRTQIVHEFAQRVLCTKQQLQKATFSIEKNCRQNFTNGFLLTY